MHWIQKCLQAPASALKWMRGAWVSRYLVLLLTCIRRIAPSSSPNLRRFGTFGKREAPPRIVDGCRGGPTPRRAPKHVAFSVIATHLSHRLASNARQSNTSRWRWIGRWTQFRDQPQDVAEQMPGNGDLGHLKRDVTTVAHNLRTNLDQPLLQGRHRPVFDRLRVATCAGNYRDCRRAREVEVEQRWPRTSDMTAASI